MIQNQEQIRVLFLAANPNPKEKLDLDGEFNQIERDLFGTRYSEFFLLQSRWQLSRERLLDILRKHRPHIVHISGHGTASQLLLQDASGGVWPLDGALAREVFGAVRDTLKLVVLNACFSRGVAEEISQVIECAIGMSTGIHDAVAMKFASALYRALGEGESVRAAFDQARTQLDLSGMPGKYVPDIKSMPRIDPRHMYPQSWIGIPAGPALRSATRTSAYDIPTDRAGVRRALQKYIPNEGDFTMFLQNDFPDVERRFSSGMDRVLRTNLLISLKDAALIAEALRRYLQSEEEERAAASPG